MTMPMAGAKHNGVYTRLSSRANRVPRTRLNSPTSRKLDGVWLPANHAHRDASPALEAVARGEWQRAAIRGGHAHASGQRPLVVLLSFALMPSTGEAEVANTLPREDPVPPPRTSSEPPVASWDRYEVRD